MRIERRKVRLSQIAPLPWPGAERPIDAHVVDELAAELLELAVHRALPDSGFNNPLELAPYEDPERPEVAYRVVAGFTRHAAWIKAVGRLQPGEPGLEELLCTVHLDCSERQLLYHHLRENVRRAPLTDSQRRTWAGRLLQLQLFPDSKSIRRRISAHGQPGDLSAGDHDPAITVNRTKAPGGRGRPRADPWFEDWFTDAPVSRRTAFEWWSRFCAATGRKHGLTPSRASEQDRIDFANWAAETQARDDARKQAAAAEARAQEAAEAEGRKADEVVARFLAFRDSYGAEKAAALAAQLFELAHARTEAA
jgi:hypothetical protein